MFHRIWRIQERHHKKRSARSKVPGQSGWLVNLCGKSLAIYFPSLALNLNVHCCEVSVDRNTSSLFLRTDPSPLRSYSTFSMGWALYTNSGLQMARFITPVALTPMVLFAMLNVTALSAPICLALMPIQPWGMRKIHALHCWANR